jgi:4-amino-4-deoxy-L-arabinose transferase-like glycosyltransferase
MITSDRADIRKDLILLCAVAALALLPGLGQNRSWAPREVRHAEIIREMVVSGDYLVPTLLGEPYLHKPPVMHAAAALLAPLVGGPSMLVARLPSALAGICGILAAYGLGRLLSDRWGALLGAAGLLAMPGYNSLAREARPDMIFCAAMLAACLALGGGMLAARGPRRPLLFWCGGLSVGIAVLTKGPHGLLFPLIFVWLAPIQRRDLRRPRLGWLAFIAGLAMILTLWAVPLYAREGGEYLRGMWLKIGTDVGGEEGGESLLTYLWLSFVMTLPLSLFLPLAVTRSGRGGSRAALGMAAATLVTMAFIPKKRGHYLLPAYPFFALGIASAIQGCSGSRPRIRRWAWGLVAMFVAAVPIYSTIVQPLMRPEEPDLVFARDVLAAVESDAIVYCPEDLRETLAWVGQGYDRSRNLSRKDARAVRDLMNAPEGSYVIVPESRLGRVMEGLGQTSLDRLMQRTVNSDRLILLRLGPSRQSTLSRSG